MTLIDWLIVVIPVTFVIGMGFYSRKYVRGVADFLSAGRVCGRYIISVGDMAGALSIIGLVSYIEIHYKTGFALSFWSRMLAPLSIILGLTGYCTYRFRETKAMSLGQFLELRYSRSLRIFAATLRSFSEILANMIMPSIAARFFIYFFDLPRTFELFGLTISTFIAIMAVCLLIAVSLICFGGTLSLIITDAIQGMFFFPIITVFVIFILHKFSWSQDIVPVMMDRVHGESFINPYDVSNLRDFNLFMVILVVFTRIIHRASWIGSGNSTAARNPHEQKMAGLLGAFRNSVVTILYVLIAVAVITVMNNAKWASDAKVIRDDISNRVSEEVIPDANQREVFIDRIKAIPPQVHKIGVDKPLSQDENLDTPILNTAHKTLKEFNGESQGNEKFQEFRTLYHQMMLSVSMRHLLPTGIMGLFCLLMIMAMISTDDSRIYSAAITLTQDVIMPLKKKPFTPKGHLKALRLTAIGIGVFFLLGSTFMSQLDYIQLFITIMCSLWLGGCGPVMIFGLYSRFGTTAGAFTSLITGMVLSIVEILVQRNWADVVYPWLARMHWDVPIGHMLVTLSKPFNPYIVWKMDPVKFPINSYEMYFFTMLITLALYCIVSLLTMKEPFNLERMLHRGKYNIDGETKESLKLSWRTVFQKMIGITKAHSTGDKIIAWGLFVYGIIIGFFVFFVAVIIWNAFHPWPLEWWSKYFFVTYLIVPATMAAIATVWFGIGGIIDLRQLFKDLKNRMDDPLDDGWVDGHTSLADKAKFEAKERESDD